jgi:hypothetical protein
LWIAESVAPVPFRVAAKLVARGARQFGDGRTRATARSSSRQLCGYSLTAVVSNIVRAADVIEYGRSGLPERFNDLVR